MNIHQRAKGFFALLLFVIATQALANPVIDQQINQSIKAYKNGNIVQIKKATNALVWTGISSQRLYDHVEARILKNYQTTDKPGIQLVGHLIKALSYSGNNKYIATLEKVQSDAAHKKIKGYAKKALVTLENHARWNPQINTGLGGLNKNQIESQRVLNMLRSPDYDLVRIGAKRVNHAHTDNTRLVKAAQKRLLREYQSDNSDKVFLDTIVWLIRALANTGDSAYKSTLEDVAANSPNRKIQKRAAKYAALL